MNEETEEGVGTFDMIKDMLVENSPYYLAVTFIVSILHSVFEFLAMKNGNNQILSLLIIII